MPTALHLSARSRRSRRCCLCCNGWYGERDPLWPAVAIFVVAFLVARSFAAVYECAVDAVFVSAVRDQAEYGAAFMSDSLAEALDLRRPARSAKEELV